MPKADLDNENPTILNVSQLPSRRQKTRSARNGPDSKYDHILFPKQPWPWGPSKTTSSWPSDDDEDEVEEDAYHDEYTEEPIDEQEIYDLISTISDPEHPHTLGQLSVVGLPDIYVTPAPTERLDPRSLRTVLVELTPTINHCSLATVIGLAVRARLEQALPPNYRVDVRMKDGSHAQDDQVNKQLADKERVAAALENDTLRGMLDKMLETCA
ncbi:hypothetical protein B0T22DRAFT_75689 [Podospora appendiculata]|uniref:MIP18 family-like domain-containing protein n=1 Tax=Podospora appendiculata TaxID=314037 RepID=A0AAE0XK34_9PEZI|nr:hypothetical protein B0T22DRAFT_75689 [Podospora appendiculata]